MIDDKKKQTQTLVALVLLLVAVAGYTYWTNRTPSKGAPLSPTEKIARAAALPSAGNAQIRLDLIRDKPQKEVVGQRNVFLYYVPPKPPPPPPPAYVPPPARGPIVSQPSGPPQAPPPPPSLLSSFKYDGVVTSAIPGTVRASISDGPVNRYNVSEGEYILGRYRIVRVTETQVEIEDTDQNRRQTYTRVTQL